MVDLARLRVRAGAEEHHVTGLEVHGADPLRPRHLAAHDVGRSAAEDAGEVSFGRVARELEHAPYEARAVEAASRRDAERRLGGRARPTPDVGVADIADGGLQQARLPTGVRG